MLHLFKCLAMVIGIIATSYPIGAMERDHSDKGAVSESPRDSTRTLIKCLRLETDAVFSHYFPLLASYLFARERSLPPQTDPALLPHDLKEELVEVLQYGKLSTVHYLLENRIGGLQANSILYSDEQLSLLHLACDKYAPRASRFNNHKTVALLIRQTADVHAPNKEGMSALHLTAEKNNLLNTFVVLLAGANPHARTPEGSTPLHFSTLMASGKNFTQCLELLLACGADVDAQNSERETPFSLMMQGRSGVKAKAFILMSYYWKYFLDKQRNFVITLLAHQPLYNKDHKKQEGDTPQSARLPNLPPEIAQEAARYMPPLYNPSFRLPTKEVASIQSILDLKRLPTWAEGFVSYDIPVSQIRLPKFLKVKPRNKHQLLSQSVRRMLGSRGQPKGQTHLLSAPVLPVELFIEGVNQQYFQENC